MKKSWKHKLKIFAASVVLLITLLGCTVLLVGVFGGSDDGRDGWDLMEDVASDVAESVDDYFKDIVSSVLRGISHNDAVANLREAENEFGLDHLSVVQPLLMAASSYHTMGDHAKAEELAKRVVEIEKAAYGADDLSVAKNLYYLGWLFELRGAYAEAVPLLEGSIAIHDLHQAQSTATYPDWVRWLCSLGRSYNGLGRYAEAEQAYLRILAMTENERTQTGVLPGSDYWHPVVEILYGLAETYEKQGKIDAAEGLYVVAMGIHKKQNSIEFKDYWQSVCFEKLGVFYNQQERYAEAEDVFTKAMASKGYSGRSDHSDIATIQNGLALVDFKRGNYEKAKERYLEALEIREESQWVKYLDVVETLEGLGAVYQAIGREDEAVEMADRAREIRAQNAK